MVVRPLRVTTENAPVGRRGVKKRNGSPSPAAPSTSTTIWRARFSVPSHFDNSGDVLTSPIRLRISGSSASSAGNVVGTGAGVTGAGRVAGRDAAIRSISGDGAGRVRIHQPKPPASTTRTTAPAIT